MELKYQGTMNACFTGCIWMALQNKIAGVDIQHIGDAGYSGVAPVENIYELSKAIRVLRHTFSKMARSILR